MAASHTARQRALRELAARHGEEFELLLQVERLKLGLTPERPPRAEHGTRSKYQSGCHCADCRSAEAAYRKERTRLNAARLAADPTLKPHGRLSTYTQWGCRCVYCRRAMRDYQQAAA
jgi:hypothetical protein